MKKIVATFMSIVMMLAILVPSALAQTESQFYDQWYEDTSWKLAKCYYNWNSTGCLGCAGINEEFITAYEYYKSVYPNSKYLAQYTNLYNSTVANKAMYDAMDESQRHIVANGYQAPCSGYFGQMTRCNGDTAFYNFYCDDGSIIENVQVSISNFGKVDNVRYDNIGFIFWSIEALNRDGQWETVGYATTAVVGGDVVKYIETVGSATVRYNDETPWAILETFDAV